MRTNVEEGGDPEKEVGDEEEEAAGEDGAAAAATDEIVSCMRAMASNPDWQKIVDISGHIASNFCETYNVANGDGAAKLLLDRTHPQDDGLYQHLKEFANRALVQGPVAP
eukprot:COSAG06_NODE_6407_length_2945_cov_76.420942_4_plen_110_part_00